MKITKIKNHQGELLIQHIPMGKIDIPPGQRNLRNLTGLVASIQRVGLQQPIVVASTDSHYRLIDGRRRFIAFQRLGRSQIPAVILPVNERLLELIKIDMHLMREESTPIERDELRRRRREICRTIHPAVDSPSTIERTPRTILQLIGRLFDI